MTKAEAKSPEMMRGFLWSLVGTESDGWTLIARHLYRRGRYGMFKLEIDNAGHSGHMTGLLGTFTPHSGGHVDRISFRFDDILEGSNPSKNPNYREPYHLDVSYENLGWSFGCIVPKSLAPLHYAIASWVEQWDMQQADIDAMLAEAAKQDGPKRRTPGAPRV